MNRTLSRNFGFVIAMATLIGMICNQVNATERKPNSLGGVSIDSGLAHLDTNKVTHLLDVPLTYKAVALMFAPYKSFMEFGQKLNQMNTTSVRIVWTAIEIATVSAKSLSILSNPDPGKEPDQRHIEVLKRLATEAHLVVQGSKDTFKTKSSINCTRILGNVDGLQVRRSRRTAIGSGPGMAGEDERRRAI